jgi:hypothetical protein
VTAIAASKSHIPNPKSLIPNPNQKSKIKDQKSKNGRGTSVATHQREGEQTP